MNEEAILALLRNIRNETSCTGVLDRRTERELLEAIDDLRRRQTQALAAQRPDRRHRHAPPGPGGVSAPGLPLAGVWSGAVTPQGDRVPGQVPPAALEHLQAIVRRYMALCDDHGVGWDQFYAALLAEEKASPRVSPEELFRLAWVRVRSVGN